MALLYLEKFGKYAVGADFATDNQTYLSGSGLSPTNGIGRFGDRAVASVNNSTFHTFPWDAVTSSETIIVSATMKAAMTQAIDADRAIFVMSQASQTSIHWALYLSKCGNLILYGPGSEIIASVPFGFDVWHHIEAKILMTNTGSASVRIDGQEVINVSGDFRNGTSGALNALHFKGSSTGNGLYFDELLVMDGTGAVFNDFIGDLRIETSLVAADGTIVDWNASTGADYECVDDGLGAYDDDATYVESSTSDQDEYFSHTVVAPGAAAIKFVALTALVADDGTNTFRLQVNSGGTIARSDFDINPNTQPDYQWYTQAWAVDPNTGTAWTIPNINAAEFGLRCRP